MCNKFSSEKDILEMGMTCDQNLKKDKIFHKNGKCIILSNAMRIRHLSGKMTI